MHTPGQKGSGGADSPETDGWRHCPAWPVAPSIFQVELLSGDPGHALALRLAGDPDLLVVAAFCLLTWEILPELSLGYPPDLRTIAQAGDASRPVPWDIQVVDDPRSPEPGRSVGEAVTSSKRLEDGWFELTSRVVFDAGAILKGTPLGSKGGSGVKLELGSIYRVDPSGNLRSFDMKVRTRDSSDELFKVTGRLKDGLMEVVARGPLPILNQKLSFPYEPRSVVHDALGPLDRLPGLHVGQRWDTRVVNPFTGQVERGPGRGPAEDADPLERKPGERLRGRAACRAAHDEDLGSYRRRDPPPGGAVSARAAGARPPPGPAPRASRPRSRPMIELRGVTKLFGTKRAVDRLDLHGPAGRALRLPRAQRRGQDDDDQDDLRPARPDRAGRSASGATTRPQPARHGSCSATSPTSRTSTTS